MSDEALMFHIDQKEAKDDVHVRFSYKEARELFDVLAALCKGPEPSDTLRYVRNVLGIAVETLEEDLSFSG